MHFYLVLNVVNFFFRSWKKLMISDKQVSRCKFSQFFFIIHRLKRGEKRSTCARKLMILFAGTETEERFVGVKEGSSDTFWNNRHDFEIRLTKPLIQLNELLHEITSSTEIINLFSTTLITKPSRVANKKWFYYD